MFTGMLIWIRERWRWCGLCRWLMTEKAVFYTFPWTTVRFLAPWSLQLMRITVFSSTMRTKKCCMKIRRWPGMQNTRWNFQTFRRYKKKRSRIQRTTFSWKRRLSRMDGMPRAICRKKASSVRCSRFFWWFFWCGQAALFSLRSWLWNSPETWRTALKR